MEEKHIVLFVFIGILAAVGGGMALIGYILGPKRKNQNKGTPYECGSQLLQATRSQFDVRFFMLAMVFILFDIETVLLLPYLIQYTGYGSPEANMTALVIAGIFFLGLVESLGYAWKKGALNWR